MDVPPIDPFAEIEKKSKFWEKVKQNPIVPIGMLGFIGMGIHGAYNYKNRGSMSTSVYLMHLRVRAQSMVVGTLIIGIAYSLVQNMWEKRQKKKA